MFIAFQLLLLEGVVVAEPEVALMGANLEGAEEEEALIITTKFQ